jgi:tetratricopeptide (TPR) repeat protein
MKSLRKLVVMCLVSAFTLVPLAVIAAESAEDYIKSGDEFYVAGDFNNAWLFYIGATIVDKNNATAYYKQGLCALKLDKMESAKEQFTQACDLGYEKACEKLKELK